MKLTQKLTQKAKLNQTLRSWLPILQAPVDELKEALEPFIKDNPFASIEQNKSRFPKNFYNELYKSSPNESLESQALHHESLYEKLYSQINAPLFPTTKSCKIANLIIECINNEGYFEWDDKILKEFSIDEVERIRARFAYLEPTGVGAKDYKESFLFQLEELCDDEKIYALAKTIICDMENIGSYTKDKNSKNR